MTSTTVSGRADAERPAQPPPSGAPGHADATVARVVGGLFLAGFLTYGAGAALVSSVTSSAHFLATLPDHRATLTLGALLMFLNTAVDIAKADLLYPVLERHSPRAAMAYLSAMIVEVVLLTVGVLGLLALIPLSQHAKAAGVGAEPDTTMGAVLLAWNSMSYQLGEIALACGAVILCVLLYRTRLVPRLLAVWGLLGYVILMTGSVAEVFGIHIGLALSIPGGLWEVTLGIYLIVKKFASPPSTRTSQRHLPDIAGIA